MSFNQKEYQKQYYQDNKEKFQYKNFSDEQKEKKLEINKEWRDNNREKMNDYNKKYAQTEKGKRANKKKRWRAMGITDPNLDEWYDKWNNATNCADCDCVLGRGQYGANRRCLDHDHKTGLVRDVVCSACNNKRK